MGDKPCAYCGRLSQFFLCSDQCAVDAGRMVQGVMAFFTWLGAIWRLSHVERCAPGVEQVVVRTAVRAWLRSQRCTEAQIDRMVPQWPENR